MFNTIRPLRRASATRCATCTAPSTPASAPCSETLDERATVVVFPSHGMGPHYDPTFLLDDVLGRLDAAGVLSGRRRAGDARGARPASR